MARAKGAIGRKQRGAKVPPAPAPSTALAPTELAAKPTGPGGLPLPSHRAGTNLVIADIVLRAAGGLLRNGLEKRLLVASYSKAKAENLVGRRNLATSMALWGASRLATRSPLGLAVVAGGLAAKVLYDQGKRIEAKRRARKAAADTTGTES